MYRVYKHTAPNGKVYIGQTSQTLAKRFRHDGTGYMRNPYFYAAIQKHGWDNFMHEVVADNLCKEEADWLEKYLIAYYHANESSCGYNLSTGGEYGSVGVVRSEEFKQHLREVNTGKTLSEEHKRKIAESNRGKKLSEEQRLFLSKINKGRKMSPEHLEKLRFIAKTRIRTKEEIEKSVSKRRGKPLSEETRRKLSESHKGQVSWNKGKHLSDEHKEKVRISSLNRKDISLPVLCVETGIIYPSANEAGRKLRMCPSHISACRSGRRQTAGGYHWEYIK